MFKTISVSEYVRFV